MKKIASLLLNLQTTSSFKQPNVSLLSCYHFSLARHHHSSWRPNDHTISISTAEESGLGKIIRVERKIGACTPKHMSRPAVLVLCVIFLSSIVTADDDSPTAYEILQSYNFPMGLLPKGALGYDLDKDTGKFNAYFNGSCGFSLEGSYQLKYKSTISGYISQNKLTKLSGVSVKVLFLWLNIVEVTRNGDDMEFSVGIASAAFPIDNFFECPQCGCGLDCVNGQVRKLKTNPFVSSI